MSIVYKKGSLFEAPKEALLVHSCNAKGVWGKGIAAEFAKNFPDSYDYYRQECYIMLDNTKTGVAFLCPKENDYEIGCLVTSCGYGKFVDEPPVILENTRKALRDLLTLCSDKSIHSNKFNSGLFNVLWEETEKILKEVMEEVGYKKDWTIWEL